MQTLQYRPPSDIIIERYHYKVIPWSVRDTMVGVSSSYFRPPVALSSRTFIRFLHYEASEAYLFVSMVDWSVVIAFSFPNYMKQERQRNLFYNKSLS